ncbi:hypothetical protein ACIQCJ_25160 [Streptomyces sp. NPDC093221]|uniref:hypothetical protein n=1 Tax=Streptomyces sp. NPDC093221 TaxID=3366032 RepID=UPI00380D4CE9
MTASAAPRSPSGFSRAYGSLQTGGYGGRAGLVTGPWADKRTTVYFTGDTRSSEALLPYTYTLAEEARRPGVPVCR